MSGSWSASWASAVRSAGSCAGSHARTDDSSVGGGKWWSSARLDVPKAPEIPADVKLLSEIRDLLAAQAGAR